MLKILALLANIILVFCQLHTLIHIKGKWNILKYYTYLQNFLACMISIVCCIFLLIGIFGGKEIPEFVRGLRYIATSGLAATMFIFIVFLGNGKKMAMTQDDFIHGFHPQKANWILHYICPVLSLISFLFFEREINLSSGIWTGLVPIPSCTYWVVYFFLTVTKRWEEPYSFSCDEKKNVLLEILPFILMPLSFVVISFILWNIK